LVILPQLLTKIKVFLGEKGVSIKSKRRAPDGPFQKWYNGQTGLEIDSEKVQKNYLSF